MIDAGIAQHSLWLSECVGKKGNDWEGWWKNVPTEDPNDIPEMEYVYKFKRPEDEVAFKIRFGL